MTTRMKIGFAIVVEIAIAALSNPVANLIGIFAPGLPVICFVLLSIIFWILFAFLCFVTADRYKFSGFNLHDQDD